MDAPASRNVNEHLANERTFLAWVRTSIALMGFGVVIAKLRFIIVTSAAAAHDIPAQAGARSTLLGIVFTLVGLATLVFAVVNYYHTRRQISDGRYEPLGGILIAFVAVVVLLGIVCIAYLLSLWHG